MRVKLTILYYSLVSDPAQIVVQCYSLYMELIGKESEFAETMLLYILNYMEVMCYVYLRCQMKASSISENLIMINKIIHW